MTEPIGSTHVIAYGRTDRGLVRPNNEDDLEIADMSTRWRAGAATLVSSPVGARGMLLAVCDGMGGRNAGEVACRITIESLRAHLVDGEAGDPGGALRRAVELANRDVWLAAAAPERRGMGATLVAVLVMGAEAYVASVGDSRAYAIRRGSIVQITKDQSYVQVLVDAGVLTREQAAGSSYRNVVLQAVGAAPDVTVALGRLELRRGDVLLLCSDGLSNDLGADEMRRTLEESSSLAAACERLVDAANARGGEDNITVLLAQVTGDALEPPRPGESASDTLAGVLDRAPARRLAS